jgi:hypothetical protein
VFSLLCSHALSSEMKYDNKNQFVNFSISVIVEMPAVCY